MRAVFAVLALLVSTLTATVAAAQEAWIQVEARPTRAEAEDRARAYARTLPDVTGYEMAAGWHAIVLGPYQIEEAARQLNLLRREGLIPGDSFLTDGRVLRTRFWPPADTAAADSAAAEAVAEPAQATVAPEPAEAAAEPVAAAPEPVPQRIVDPFPPAEGYTEARNSEALLTREEREELQRALAWFGYYTAGIDGAFGPGTRAGMSEWQSRNGFDPNGILGARQRAILLAAWRDDLAAMGLRLVRDDRAGIEIELPTAMVEFDHYEAPFAHFREKDGSGVRVYLISQQGDATTLFGLYEIMQTLEIVPLDGPRERRASSFTIEGRNATLASYTQAELSGGLIKGFTLVWDPRKAARIDKVLDAMKASFRPFGDVALDDALAAPDSAARADMLAGLEVRRPERVRSGVFVDGAGRVLTAYESVDGCDRLTVDQGTEAALTASDAGAGLALLTPVTALAPADYAAFRAETPRSGAEIALAGFAYADLLDTPVMTFGRFAGPGGFDGAPGLLRLDLEALEGDTGGAIFDTSGAVLGLLLPRSAGGARPAPEGAALARDAGAITAFLLANGVDPRTEVAAGAMAAEDLGRRATGMATRVACWN
ncbi:MAG: serine protease [Rhodobacteraceae bacterium]|nr:serine protease [Paracoccaceae bacterium]